MTAMEFTGERFVPNLPDPHTSYEHWHRYLFASQLTAGERVLDLACGEGYGSFFLSLTAESVVGVDVDAATVVHASNMYVRPNLKFVKGPASRLPPEWTGAFDVVVSFETIEHLSADDQMFLLAEVRRVLSPDGILIASTPNRLAYSELSGKTNPYHLHELYVAEFRQLLERHFAQVQLWGQRVYPASYMWSLQQLPSTAQEFLLSKSEGGFRPSNDPKEVLYTIAVAGAQPRSVANASILIDLSDELVRRGLQAAEQAATLQDQVVTLKEETKQLRERVDELQRHETELVAHKEELDQAAGYARSMEGELERLRAGLADADRHIQSLQGDIDVRQRANERARERLKRAEQEAAEHRAIADDARSRLSREREVAQDLRNQLHRVLRRVDGYKARIRTLEDQAAKNVEEQSSIRSEELEAALDQLQDRHRAVAMLSEQLAQRDVTIREQAARDHELVRLIAEHTDTINDLQSQLVTWNAHWEGVQASRAWRLVMVLRGTRKAVFPDGSKRWRLLKWLRGARPLPPATTVTSQTAPEPLTPSFTEDSIEALARIQLITFLRSGRRLILPRSADPTVSVVVPVWNQAHYLLLMLQSLPGSAGSLPFEVILIDNGSGDEVADLLDQVDNVEIIRNERNLGFGEACNQGAGRARGKLITFLNSDTVPSPGCLSALMEACVSDSSVGAAGAKLILPDGRLQEAGSIIWRDGSTLGYGRGNDPTNASYDYRRPVDYVSAAALMVRRELFASVGGFDSRYVPAYYEDADLCMEFATAGFHVVYEPRAVVLHLEHASSDRGHAVSLQIRNRGLFQQKWAPSLVGRGMPTERDILRFRDTRPGKRLLVLDDRIPESWIGSGFPRTDAMLRALAATAYVVTYLPTADPRRAEPATTELQNLGIEVLHGVTDVDGEIERRANLYDLALISRPHNARFLHSVVRWNPGAAIVYDAESVFSLREVLRAEVEGRPMDESTIQRMIERELAPMRDANLVLTVSELERQTVKRFHPSIAVEVWGHAVRVQAGAKAPSERHTILFVGYLESGPNRDSLRHLLEDIMPVVIERTDAPLVVAGKGASDELMTMAARFGKQVNMRGFVEDLDEVYSDAHVFVAAHRYSAGIPLKVVEAMSRGVPCVISPLLARQLGVQDGQEVFVAHTPEEWACKIHELFINDDTWYRVRACALDFVRAHFDPHTMRTSLVAALDAAARTAR